MEIVAFSIIFLLIIVLVIDHFTFRLYLSKKYSQILSWLKGGSFFQKGTLIGFNNQRDLSLMFQKREQFLERYNGLNFIAEYEELLSDKRYLLRKWLLSVIIILNLLIISCWICLGFSTFS